MSTSIVEITESFWNIRGTFRLFGLLDIGTQASLVRLAPGRFVLLDSLTLEGEVRDRVLAATNGGADLEAVINLHPFHTVNVEATAALFPNARWYGTERHHRMFPELPWREERTESEAFAALYAEHFDLLVPRGVHFIPDDEKLHFASVLAIHRESGTLHVDDTLNWVPIPFMSRLDFHPTLAKVLKPGADSATAFREWAKTFADRCATVRTVCTAHTKLAPLRDEAPGVVAEQVKDALGRVEKVLAGHR